MSATQKQNSVATEAREAEPGLLQEIIDRMSVIEAKQSRPSPVQLRTWEEIERFAEKAARSGMVPKDYVGKPDAIVIAVQLGSELGLPPMQSLQNIAVVNGRPSVWGDALPALCRASGLAAYIKEWHEGEGDDLTYICEAKRKDDPNPTRMMFSVADAKRASLWKTEPKTTKRGREGEYTVDSGPWYSYPQRMLQMRARGFCLRDAFPDVLKGLITTEEAQDIPFAATGLTPRLEPETVVRAVAPEQPKRRTLADFIQELEPRLKAAANALEVDAIVAEAATQKAMDFATDGAKTRLNTMIQEALDRTTPSQARRELEEALARTANRPPMEDPAAMDGEAEYVDEAVS